MSMTPTQAARIAALEAEVEDLRNMKRMADEMIRIQGNKNDKLCAEVERLREALEPFVQAQGFWGHGIPDGASAGWMDFPGEHYVLPLTVGDMRRARRALNPEADDG